jgi:DNA-binding MarR family transcriptional regulator
MTQADLTSETAVGLPTMPPKKKVKHHKQTARLSSLKRYNLALPEELFNELQELANTRQTTVVDLLRRFIKLGLIAASTEEQPDSGIFIRENGSEREIILI